MTLAVLLGSVSCTATYAPNRVFVAPTGEGTVVASGETRGTTGGIERWDFLTFSEDSGICAELRVFGQKMGLSCNPAEYLSHRARDTYVITLIQYEPSETFVLGFADKRVATVEVQFDARTFSISPIEVGFPLRVFVKATGTVQEVRPSISVVDAGGKTLRRDIPPAAVAGCADCVPAGKTLRG